MIVVRDEFRLKFGKAREMKALMKEGKALIEKYVPGQQSRALTDLTGPAYRLVLESTFARLAEYEQSMSSTLGADEWGAWYQKVMPLVESSNREILTILD